ncbi:hypothetical protein ACFFX1_27190 [Dactylosporangium sucinum]|uniref:Uncharacterized protein n=1 Tax=Dactylosporangium sucinum TaxID=1424081 RepID=A0A917WIE9_9ACTN|nr:hypothetical protein [Dactylosporangium sucinum]GGM06519.1 hypothetical protein GCM10007977_004550 [Dactylosporangium sucinum]
MGTENGDEWAPRTRVGAVVVALLNGDAEGAERAAGQPPEPHDTPVLDAAIRLAVRSLFDEDTPPDDIAGFVAAITQDVDVDPAAAEALIRTQLGEEGLLDAFPPHVVTDTTWSMLGYLCERQLGREDSLQLVEQAERTAVV